MESMQISNSMRVDGFLTTLLQKFVRILSYSLIDPFNDWNNDQVRSEILNALIIIIEDRKT